MGSFDYASAFAIAKADASLKMTRDEEQESRRRAALRAALLLFIRDLIHP
jgi:hypothetical protein